MYPSDFKHETDFYDLFNKHGLQMGRMVSGSKSFYRSHYPENFVVFNANVIIRSKGKIWYGDLDLTLDEPKLKAIAEELGESLFVLYESDARFGDENRPVEILISKAVATILP